MSRGTNDFDPFTITEPQKYYPPHISSRIPAQHALFTVEPNPTVELSIKGLIKILFPETAKQTLRIHLSLLGFHEESMYPNLDGSCAHLSWRLANNQGGWSGDIPRSIDDLEC